MIGETELNAVDGDAGPEADFHVYGGLPFR